MFSNDDDNINFRRNGQRLKTSVRIFNKEGERERG